MDEIYEWLNPRVPIEYILFSFLMLCVAIVVVMLMTKGKKIMRLVLGALLIIRIINILLSDITIV